MEPELAWGKETGEEKKDETIALMCICVAAQLVKNPPAMQETSVQFLSREDPLEQGTATHSSFLA